MGVFFQFRTPSGPMCFVHRPKWWKYFFLNPHLSTSHAPLCGLREERALPQGGRSLVSLSSKYFFLLDLLQSTASSCIMPAYAIRSWEWWMNIWHVKNMPIWTSIWEECVSHQIIGFLACGDTFTNVKCKTHSCLTEGNFPFLPIFSNEQKKRPHCTWLLWSGVILWKLRQSATLRVSHMCRQATPLIPPSQSFIKLFVFNISDWYGWLFLW